VADPYPFYDKARETGELVFWKDYGMAAATTMGAVMAVLKDRRMGREAPAEAAPEVAPHLRPFYAVEAHSMLELEPPRHTRLRSLVLRAFTSRRIKALGPEIEALCHQLIDAFPAGEVDLLTAYAQKLPVIVIARFLGVPEAVAEDLLGWSNAMVAVYQASCGRAAEERAALAATEFVDFLNGYVDERRSDPRDDLITHLIAAEENGERLTRDELISTCILLLNAGHEATVHTLGNGIKTLLETGSGVTRETAPMTVEEILRFDPPLHMFTRWVYEDLELFGETFRRGDRIACLLASANRDPKVWDAPEDFDPTRRVQPNAAFGAGIHFCVGAPLARLELQTALPILFSRCPNLRMTATPQYADLYHFHGLESLIVNL
jgi:cytochrome P450